jgi:hypothetical protein
MEYLCLPEASLPKSPFFEEWENEQADACSFSHSSKTSLSRDVSLMTYLLIAPYQPC